MTIGEEAYLALVVVGWLGFAAVLFTLPPDPSAVREC
jgi:hypothetical protein